MKAYFPDIVRSDQIAIMIEQTNTPFYLMMWMHVNNFFPWFSTLVLKNNISDCVSLGMQFKIEM